MEGENGKIPHEAGEKREPKVGYKCPPVHSRFKPGNCANPGGRPKGESVTAILRRILSEPLRGESKKTRAEHLARRLLDFAGRGGKGDAAYAKEVLNRVEGAVPGEGELTVRVVLVKQGPPVDADN